MLPVSADAVRLFLHVLAASVWVGGQLTLAGLVPGLRSLSPDAPRVAARLFNRIAWPAFAVLVVTGMWNIIEVGPVWNSDYGHTLVVKIVFVAGAGLTAFAHAQSRSRRSLAIFGVLTMTCSLGALFLGILLAG
jgi:putative copper export protein